ncbi:MAG: hypothetical protein US20_C0002G0008 [Candidatus Pacebacteria bacterium GW2011_GWF1_36_5]|nr:MAG: hypothetical protein US20_C0002G0008 [Candidatus Pacebacteria bacterium GW2011_GWF1_36_5]
MKFHDDRIWECACGDGVMAEIIQKYNKYVICTDLYDYGYGEFGIDFLKTEKRLANTIITNPPFKLAEQFIIHAYEIGINTMALLLKLSFLEGQKRKKLFSVLPPKEILVFSKRLTMTRNGEPSRNGGMIAFAWYIWEFGYKGRPQIGWI